MDDLDLFDAHIVKAHRAEDVEAALSCAERGDLEGALIILARSYPDEADHIREGLRRQ